MAWIKFELDTPDKPEVIAIASALGIDQDAVVGKLLRLWIWADRHTLDGNASCNAGSNANSNAVSNGPVTSKSFIDRYTYAPGFAEAMVKVGWLIETEDGWSFPNFDKHNGETAKQRALTAKRAEKHRGKSNAKSNGTSVTDSVTKSAPREERGEGEGEDPLAKNLTLREVKGNTLTGESEPVATPRTPRRSRGKVFDGEEDPGKFELPQDFDWDETLRRAEAVAKRVPPLSDDDRRAWIRYAVLSITTFSEAWLLDAAEAVALSTERKKTRQAQFVGILQGKAFDLDELDEENFNALARRIEIPTKVWKSKALQPKGVKA